MSTNPPEIVKADPAYHDGFFDAQDGEPLFPDASAPYEAGWRAYWRAHEILADAGFAKEPDGSFTKRTTTRARSTRTAGT